ncbi:MAG TPA: PhnD/SsuA/transferrin family substrate-binding protein [Candidatus Limnocylindria bacterium]|nr:PhnD/SsuA/transferrin family substrate-binding protein [Candidatus Limnocylindria bacterium]
MSFKADGTPDLTGVQISLGNSAGDATIGDTVVYMTAKTLEQWGATVNFQLGSGNTTQLAVVGGQLNATAGPMPAALNAGLSIFGNSQVHVDYLLVAKTFSAIEQLKGKTVAVATTVSPDQLLLDGALQKAKLTRGDVVIALTGSNSASVNQMLQGKVDAAFVHADALLKLQKTGTFNVLANSTELEPWDADSYLCAMPDWLKANPATAEAIDLAWLHAAKVFDSDKQQWIKYAVEFTKGTVTAADASASYDALAKAAPWPADGTGLEQDTLQKNFDVNKTNGQIKGAGDRPETQWFAAKPWTDAVAYFKAHSSAF